MFGSTDSIKKIILNGTLRVVEGDATDPQTTHEKEICMITHCCNDEGGWGKGFVLALSNKWELPEKHYRAFYAGTAPYPARQEKNPILGRTCYAKIDKRLLVDNMIGKHVTVCEDNPKPVKYGALASAMKAVVGYIRMIQTQVSNPVVIHCPKFGSDLAGGDWNFILELIRECWLEEGIDVVVYEWVG